MGRFGQVSARLATRPVLIGFGQFQPAMNNKNNKPVGFSGMTDRVCASGRRGESGWTHLL
jgi:hypothetical protein